MHVLSTCSRLGASTAVGFNLFNPGTQSIPRRKERKEGRNVPASSGRKGRTASDWRRQTYKTETEIDRQTGRKDAKGKEK